MDSSFLRSVICLGLILPIVGSTILCGEFECHGHKPYCCLLDDGETEGCCWDTFVYQLWWFWAMWIIMFFLILACSLSCWRRRNQRVRYVVMNNSQYPTYGTVIHSHSATGQVQQGGVAMPPNMPPQPPAYVNKPPPYSS